MYVSIYPVAAPTPILKGDALAELPMECKTVQIRGRPATDGVTALGAVLRTVLPTLVIEKAENKVREFTDLNGWKPGSGRKT